MANRRKRTPQTKAWWKATTSDELTSHLLRTVEQIRQASRTRREEDKFHLALYGNFDDGGRGYKAIEGLYTDSSGRLRYNLAASVIGTAASLIAQLRPMPYYLTNMGDFSLQRKARERTRVLEGQYWDLGAYKLGPEVFIQAAVLGTGCVHGYIDPDTGKAELEAVMPLELLVDHTEGRARKPRSLYRIRLIAREVLTALYPGEEDAIARSGGPSGEDWDDFFMDHDSTVDQVILIEAWHLPSTSESGDGRHVLCTTNAVLVDDEWDRQTFPFAFYRYEERPVGFWGMGLCEKVRAAQWRIDQLIKRAERLQDLGSNAYVFVEKNSGVTANEVTNLPLQVIEYQGAPPRFEVVTATPPDLQQEIERIRQMTLEELALAPSTVQGMPPSPSNSGVAIRATDDIQSRRHIIQSRGYEDFFMDIARLIVELNDDLAEQDPSHKVTGTAVRGSTSFLKSTRWKELKIPEGETRIRMFPVSALPTTPQGKWSAVQEWIQGGFVSRTFGMQLLDFPDMDAATSLQNAMLDSIMFDIERILDGEKDVLPDDYGDKQLSAQVGVMALAKARTMGAPDDVLWALREYIDAAREGVPPAPTPEQAAPPPEGPGIPAQGNLG